MSYQANHSKLIKLTLIIVALVGIIIYTYLDYQTDTVDQKSNQTTATINGRTFVVDIADSQSERIRGLSNRISLAPNEGMLFIFNRETRPAFWMKDMNFAIDILWINHNLEIVGIIENLSPDTYPKTYRPDIPIRYVLELPAKTTSHYGIRLGDQVHLNMN